MIGNGPERAKYRHGWLNIFGIASFVVVKTLWAPVFLGVAVVATEGGPWTFTGISAASADVACLTIPATFLLTVFLLWVSSPADAKKP